MLPVGPSLLLLAAALLGASSAAGLSITRIVRAIASGTPVEATSLGAVIVSLVVLAVPAATIVTNYRQAQGLPPIHDITTDTANPPEFVDVVSRRRPGENSLAYGGDAIAQQQHAAYPDLQGIVLAEAPEVAFARVVAGIQSLGWELVGQDMATGRIEATDTTFWFGFKDDVVVRVLPNTSGARIDIRSASRVGGGDVGTNARRIRTLMATLR